MEIPEWLHCNVCYYYKHSQNTLFVGDCSHCVCRNCLKSDECPVCNSKSVFVPYHSEKLNQVLTPANVHLEDLTALLTYQTNQSNDMISYLKKSCLNYCLQSKKNESNYTHSKLLLKQAYEENQKLKRENEELKKELRKRFDGENLYHDKREPEYVSKHFRVSTGTNAPAEPNLYPKQHRLETPKQSKRLNTSTGNSRHFDRRNNLSENVRHYSNNYESSNSISNVGLKSRLDYYVQSPHSTSRFAPSPAKSYNSRLTLQSRDRPQTRLLPSRDRAHSRLSSRNQMSRYDNYHLKNSFETNVKTLENPFL